MKRFILIIICLVSLAVATNAKSDNKGNIMMTIAAMEEVSLTLYGTGTVIIDWGDGKSDRYDEIEKNIKPEQTVSIYTGRDTVINLLTGIFSHIYSAIEPRTIRISGENITHLRCEGLGISHLDVSKNPALIQLFCGRNELTSLDVSKNPKLIHLFCRDNKFTSTALNALFQTLNNTVGDKRKEIGVENNSGTADCDTSIASSKGWNVYTF
jgi:hypothetical protein